MRSGVLSTLESVIASALLLTILLAITPALNPPPEVKNDFSDMMKELQETNAFITAVTAADFVGMRTEINEKMPGIYSINILQTRTEVHALSLPDETFTFTKSADDRALFIYLDTLNTATSGDTVEVRINGILLSEIKDPAGKSTFIERAGALNAGANTIRISAPSIISGTLILIPIDRTGTTAPEGRTAIRTATFATTPIDTYNLKMGSVIAWQ